MKKPLKSIRYKLIFTMLFIFLIFVIIVLGIWYTELRSEAEETAIANMETIISVSNTTFENQVKDIINVTALTTVRSDNNLSTNIINIISRSDLTDAEIIAYRRAASDYLISLCSFKKNLNGLMLSDFSGNNITYGITTSFEAIKEEKWLELLSDKSVQNILIEPHYADKWYRNKNDLVFSILRPVYNYSNAHIGFAWADINCQLFNDSFDVTPTNQCSLYVINNKGGKVIFTPHQNLLEIQDGSTLDSAILNNLTASSGHFFETVNGTKMLVVFNKSDLTGWCTLSVIDAKDIVAAFYVAAHKIIIITALVITLLILCVFIVSSILTHNIVLLTNAVRGIDKTQLDLDIEIHSADEIGSLTIQFKSMLTRIKELLAEVKHTEREKRNAEIAALQFQMNPHFLYNSLNTIKFLANLQGADNISNVAESLSSLMHINMDGRSFITIEEDIAFNKAYLSIQNYRHINTFSYNIIATPEVYGYLLPKLITQPLIENALKHGLKDKKADGILLLYYTINDSNMHIRVEDNGIGMSEDIIYEITSKKQNDSAGHIGIHNLLDRIKLYFGEDYGIEINSQPHIYSRFEITLPLVTEEDLKQNV